MLRMLLIVVCLHFIGCKGIRKRTDLVSGTYQLSSDKRKKVYVSIDESAINVFNLTDPNKVDSAGMMSFPRRTSENFNDRKLKIISNTFDLDVLSIPFKYRPTVSGFPNQLNTSFSGAMYFGYRRDNYRLYYLRQPTGFSDLKVRHLAYSVGLFSGIGATPMNPWVTEYKINSEYDGVVNLNGFSINVGINNFAFGAALGFDMLLDPNRKHWIYQYKPWTGLTIGLNLN